MRSRMPRDEEFMSNIPPFQTVPEAAATFRVSRSSLYSLAKAGKIRLRKLGGRTLVDTSEILAMLGSSR